jgi:ribosomal protein S18 acetylase RimI-like enzyme
MIEISPLTQITPDLLGRLITGYVSDAKYAVQRVESEALMTFALELVTLDQPYVKHYDHPNSETFAALQKTVEEGVSVGAYDADQWAGIAIAGIQRWNCSLWVYEFHVAEGQRGKGIGRRMMEALVENSRAANLRAIYCETQTTNVPAIRFYRHLGFTLDGLNLSFYTNNDWPNGEMAVFMKRTIE